MLKLSRNEERVILAALIIMLGVFVIYKFVVFKTENVRVIEKDSDKTIDMNDQAAIFVYITGEVKNPGLHKLYKGDRIADLIDSAGGFTDNADVVSVNLAEKLTDEQYVNIRLKDSTAGSTADSNTGEKNSVSGGKININAATAEELDKFLPGIGETRANSIVNYRDKNGRFKSIDEITRVDGIGSGKTFEKIKDLIIIY